ncbi:MAG: class I SAM-dependent methyltransferase [Lacunisphaera sp.]
MAAVDEEYRSGAWDHFHQLRSCRARASSWVTSRSCTPTPAILDLGCGSGRLAQLFQPHTFRRYLGVDLSTEGIRLAQALNLRGCEFATGNFEEGPRRSDST